MRRDWPMDDDGAHVTLARLEQATTATLPDVFFRNAALIFVEAGDKRIVTPDGETLEGGPGDVFAVAAGAFVTMENRVWDARDYRATVVFYPETGFPPASPGENPEQIALLPHGDGGLYAQKDKLWALAEDDALPSEVMRHRLVEPLLWLRAAGIALTLRRPETAAVRLRALIDADPAHPWRAQDAAQALHMSEATLRRALGRTGDGFSRLLRHARLERGLTLLQSSDAPISKIAVDCGFATPSHFADAFKARFGVNPKRIRAR